MNRLKLLEPFLGISVTKEYLDFICSCENDPEIYSENHHILPRSLFPEYKNDKNNLVKLTAYNHYKAHYILAKSNNPKMLYAFNMMSRIIPLLENKEDIDDCARMYQEHREKIIETIKKTNTGRKASKETRKRLTELRTGKIYVKEKSTGKIVHIDKNIYNSNKELYIHHSSNRTHSTETITKMKSNSNKGKIAFTHKETSKVIYRSKDFTDKDYIQGNIKHKWATDYFTGTKHWYNPETGAHRRCQESPGQSWVQGRKDYNNYFKDNIRIIDVRSGESGYVNKSKRKIYQIIPNRIVVCDIIENRLFLDDYFCDFLGIDRKYYNDIKNYIRGKEIRSNKTKLLFEKLKLERYFACPVSDIDFKINWKLEYVNER